MNITEQLFEAVKKTGPESLIGRAAERVCEKDLKGYFSALGQVIMKRDFPKLADPTRPSTRDQVFHAVTMSMENLLRARSTELLHILASNIQKTLLRADTQVLVKEAEPTQEFEVILKLQFEDKVGLSAKEAAAYAAERAAEQVKAINETTRQEIANTVAKGIEDQLGVPGTARLLRDVLDGFSARATLIARTEMANAMNQAQFLKLARIGIEYKQIILSADACQICQDNADEDPLPYDDAYSSGDLFPPFHPNCRCSIVGARPPEE